MSISVGLDGKEVLIPLLVPTLSDNQKKHLLAGRKAPKSVVKKAIEHAKIRISEGKSPFAEDGYAPGKMTRDNYEFDDTFQRNVNLDRGHLGRFGTTQNGVDAEASFKKANIEPMKSTFNRGKWLDIENEFKAIIARDGDAHVVTGAIKDDWLTPSIVDGDGTRREIPRRFYKAIKSSSGTKVYIATNNRGDDVKVITLKELAKLSGYRFFSDL